MNKAPCSKVNDGFTKETWSVSGKNNQIQDKVPPIVQTHQISVPALYVKKIASKEPYFGIARYEHSHTCHVNASLQLILQISNIRKILTENKFRKNTLCSAIKELCIFMKKINFIFYNLRIIPKKYTTPNLISNLWTVLIRPIFDYAIIIASLKSERKLNTHVTKERARYKKMMGIRITKANSIFEMMMGYNPTVYAKELIEMAKEKWKNRINYQNSSVENKKDCKYNTNLLVISWNGLRTNNVLYQKCPHHPELLFNIEHLKNYHCVTLISMTKTIQ